MICLENVTRRFGKYTAVDDVSFTLQTGSLTGFLGPNGAGKTTTMRMAAGYLRPDSGRVRLDGADPFTQPKAARAALGYLPESTPLYEDMTVVEYLETCAGLREMRGAARQAAVSRVVSLCGLREHLKAPIGVLSKGYKQRVGLAQAIIHRPKMLLLDEPTSGLDPNQIRDIRNLIRDISQEAAILLSTHLLDQVPELCDRVLVLNAGKIIFDGSPEQLVRQGAKPVEAVVTVDRQEAWEKLALELAFIRACKHRGSEKGRHTYRLQGDFPAENMAALHREAAALDLSVSHLEAVTPHIDQVFTKLTQGEA